MKDICSILDEVKSIVVVGLSDKPGRASGDIASYLKNHDYNVEGVHPRVEEFDGITVYKKLADVPSDIDLVDIFLGSDKITPLVDEIIEAKPKYVWFQLGITNNEAASKLEDAGIGVIQDKCIKIEHRRCS